MRHRSRCRPSPRGKMSLLYSPPWQVMMTSVAIRSEIAFASLSGPVALPPTFGPGAPTCDVVKNTGSIEPKSPSASMRCISTEPTIPRHPTNPTRFMIFGPECDTTCPAPDSHAAGRLYWIRSARGSVLGLLDERFDDGRAHFGGANGSFARSSDIGRAQARRQDGAHGGLDPVG